jgi:hypothetical protein
VFGQETGVLYQYETSSGIQWKTFGDGKVQPKYKGEIKNGVMDGLGVLIYPYGEKSVVGEWKEGKEWNTKHTKKDGTLLGKFENGVWIIRWGVLYEGWRNNEDGYFEEKWEGVKNKVNGDYSIYEGEIKNGEPNGMGIKIWYTGHKYVGEWKDGEKTGQGTLTMSDGTKSVGRYGDNDEWFGTVFYPDGTKFIGERRGDFPWNGKYYNPFGRFQSKIRDGKIVKK